MTEKNPPYVLQNRTDHKSDAFRLLMSGLMGRAEGVYGPTDLVVTQDTGSNMNSRVGVGGMFTMGDESITQGGYAGYNDASVVLTHGAAPGTPGQSRRDLVCARVRDQIYSGATNAWDLVIIAGTASASPSDPGVPNNSIALARVTIAFGQTAVTNANIADLRPKLPQGISVTNSARRPGVLYGPMSINALGGPAQAAAYAGLFCFDADTFSLLHYTTATTGWQGPWNLPWGEIGYADNSASADQTVSSTPAPITGTTVIFTAIPGRKYRTELHLQNIANASGTNPTVNLAITDGASAVKRISTIYFQNLNDSNEFHIVHRETGLTGSVTRRGQLQSATGLPIVIAGGATIAGHYCHLAVYDDGPYANPS